MLRVLLALAVSALLLLLSKASSASVSLKGPKMKLTSSNDVETNSKFPPTPPRCNETPYDADREDFKTFTGYQLIDLCGERYEIPIYNCTLEKEALTLESLALNFTLSFPNGQSKKSRKQALEFAYKLYSLFAFKHIDVKWGCNLKNKTRTSTMREGLCVVVRNSSASHPVSRYLKKLPQMETMALDQHHAAQIVFFATAWCDLKADLGNLFIRKCSNWNEMKNKEVVKKLMINKTVKDPPDNREEKNVSYPAVEYYCALTQVARLAQQFNVTGLVQFYRPMRTSQPTAEVVAELSKTLAAYQPVALHDEHFPVGCDMGVRSYRKRVQQKKKNRRKKKQKKRFVTITEYDAYCVDLTGEFVEQVLEKIFDGTSTGDIKIILDSLNKQE